MKNEDHDPVLHLQRFAQENTRRIPDNEASSLTASIQIGAQAAAEGPKRVIAPAESELPPIQLLGAVSYCYAKGVYESAEIEREMLRNPEMRAATHGNVPAASSIRRFRWLNRDAIRKTLEEAFRFLRRKEKAAALVPLPGQPATSEAPLSFDPQSTLTYVRKEAERTLNDAAFVDNMSKE